MNLKQGTSYTSLSGYLIDASDRKLMNAAKMSGTTVRKKKKKFPHRSGVRVQCSFRVPAVQH